MFKKWWEKFYLLCDEAGDNDGGGGDDGGGDDGGGDKDVEALKKENEEYRKRLEAFESKKKTDETDLAEKARKEREERERKAGESKQVEKAIAFNLGAKKWLDENKELLPESIKGIFEAAEKQNYDTAVDKDAAIKSGIISEFFAIQDNVDLLTSAQKVALDQFLKLTKTVKEQRAQKMYDDLFEPTFESLKRFKRAQELGKGEHQQSDASEALKKKIMESSERHYLIGDKK